MNLAPALVISTSSVVEMQFAAFVKARERTANRALQSWLTRTRTTVRPAWLGTQCGPSPPEPSLPSLQSLDPATDRIQRPTGTETSSAYELIELGTSRGSKTPGDTPVQRLKGTASILGAARAPAQDKRPGRQRAPVTHEIGALPARRWRFSGFPGLRIVSSRKRLRISALTDCGKFARDAFQSN